MSGRMRSLTRFCATAALLAIAACTPPPPPPALPAPPPPPAPVAGNPLDRELPGYLRLPGLAPDQVPVRVGIILPFSSASAGTRNLAASMLKAAEMAMFDFRQPQHYSDDSR